MSDYISREDALICAKGIYGRSCCDQGAEDASIDIYNQLKFIPPADVRENIHGTWEHWEGETFFDVPICSNCGMTFSRNARGWSFCPNCGADMRGEEK